MISNELIASIKYHEGAVQDARTGKHKLYTDSVGVPTIGYGHNLEQGISERVADLLLQDDIGEAVSELNKHLEAELGPGAAGELYGPRLDTLYEMSFNMGMPRLSQFKKMWAALAAKDYVSASSEMLDSRWADQVGRRAVTLAEQMQTGEYA